MNLNLCGYEWNSSLNQKDRLGLLAVSRLWFQVLLKLLNMSYKKETQVKNLFKKLFNLDA